MMTVYRISNCKYVNDLSGKGAALYGGRWNNKDTYLIYTAQSRALALLETVVHTGKIPEDGFCLVAIELPDTSLYTYTTEQLPPGWHSSPPPDYLKAIGDEFVRKNKYLAIKVPSVLMMEEYNLLINPAHPMFGSVKITSHRQLNMDQRLYPTGASR
jgi:RES domain-containing protein